MLADIKRFLTGNHCVTSDMLREYQGFLIMYDVTSEDSFEEARHYLQLIQKMGVKPRPPMILLANKVDLQDVMRVVDRGLGESLADDFGASYMETSGKTGLNVENAVMALM